jgi:hypothetical protein
VNLGIFFINFFFFFEIIFFFPVKQFYYEFKNCLSKETTWESVFRIRITPGWRISATYGNFIIKTTDLLSYITDPNKTLVYEF